MTESEIVPIAFKFPCFKTFTVSILEDDLGTFSDEFARFTIDCTNLVEGLNLATIEFDKSITLESSAKSMGLLGGEKIDSKSI